MMKMDEDEGGKIGSGVDDMRLILSVPIFYLLSNQQQNPDSSQEHN